MNVHTLTHEELRDAVKLGKHIRDAEHKVEAAFGRLEMMRKRCGGGKTWTVSLALETSNGYGSRDNVEFHIPSQMVEQQLTDVLNAAKRTLAQLLAQGRARP